MRNLMVSFLLAAVCACSGESGKRADGGSAPDYDEQQDPSQRENGADARVARPADRDAARGDQNKGEEPEFASCAEARVDAERGPRGGNIVWVIDTSGSMDEEAALVQQHLNGFAKAIVAAGLADYRVVVVSQREFVQVPDPLGSDREHFLHIEEKVGSDEPLTDLLKRHPDYKSFLLPGVITHFVVVTDDESEIPAQEFTTQMRTRLGSDFRVHAIASPPGDTPPQAPTDPLSDLFGDGDDDDDTGCRGAHGDAAEPGVEHWEAARLTQGLTFSICSDDWTPLFTELAKVVGDSAKVPCSLALPEAAPGEVINFELINVVYTEPSASDGAALSKVEGEGGCGTKQAWYYDNPSAPRSIALCPSACAAAEQGGSLEVVLGCQIFVQ